MNNYIPNSNSYHKICSPHLLPSYLYYALGCRLKNRDNLSEMEMDLLVTHFFGFINDANDCHSKYKKNLAFNSTAKLREDERASFCDACGMEYKNLSSYFNLNIVNKAQTNDDICQDILDKVSFVI